MNKPLRRRNHDAPTLTVVEPQPHKGVNGAVVQVPSSMRSRKQRVTITLPVALLERLRNAVYWTGHGTLARLIADALGDAVAQMEQANGQAFPQRLAPLKRGRPRSKGHPTPTLAAFTTGEPDR
jgi:hypothetical protein